MNTTIPTTDMKATTQAATTKLEDVGETVRSVAGDVATRLPDAAAATRDALAVADRQMRSGSDEMLAMGTTLSFGLAVGLLLGGANRVLIALALAPAAAMALTLFGRGSATGARVARTR